MSHVNRDLIPYIPPEQYDTVATDFLERYCPDALANPMAVPIEKIATDEMHLDVKYICLSEELDIFGMTVFTDGIVEFYDPVEGLYDSKLFKAKTVLIDPEAVKRTNTGCKNNTVAHECVHWFKHRYYYKMATISAPRYAKYCKCPVDQFPVSSDEENLMEAQATGIAPRILMPKATFIEAAEHLGVGIYHGDESIIRELATIFDVSKQSVRIRLEECSLI